MHALNLAVILAGWYVAILLRDRRAGTAPDLNPAGGTRLVPAWRA